MNGVVVVFFRDMTNSPAFLLSIALFHALKQWSRVVCRTRRSDEEGDEARWLATGT